MAFELQYLRFLLSTAEQRPDLSRVQQGVQAPKAEIYDTMSELSEVSPGSSLNFQILRWFLKPRVGF